ncbi:MAG: hypothetical protein IJS54_06050 [Desulfovibrio sp.]|nr:hypothetical protein [Desulfovibrio sp.]
MLDIAVSQTMTQPSYRDLMDVLGKLDAWVEQQQESQAIQAAPPPQDLVTAFNNALEKPQGQVVENVQAEQLPSPESILQSQQIHSDPTQPQTLTLAQEVNLDRGMGTIDQVGALNTNTANNVYPTENVQEILQNLLDIINKDAMSIPPADILHAQRLVGLLRVHAESGKKVSEGVSDTLEQVLESQ